MVPDSVSLSEKLIQFSKIFDGLKTKLMLVIFFTPTYMASKHRC